MSKRRTTRTGPKTPAVQDRIWRERIAPAVVRRDMGVCWICGHAGADTADHVFPRAEMTDEQKRTMMFDQRNLRAVHQKPCEICSALSQSRGYGSIRCNPLRGAYSVERVRRIIDKRTGQKLSQGTAVTGEQEGRDF